MSKIYGEKAISAFDAGIGKVARQYYAGDRTVPLAEHQGVTFQIGMVMDDQDDQSAHRLWVYFPNFSSINVDAASVPSGPVASSDSSLRQSWILCFPMFPFFGSDSFRQGTNDRTVPGRNAYRGQSNSYGWSFQPRIGDYVGVLFANGDPAQAYWFSCIPKVNQTFMVPGTPGVVEDNDTSINPEIVPSHEESADDFNLPRVEMQTFSANLRVAGLMRDTMRGAGTASAIRESPSYVSGFKSPGWSYEIEQALPIGGGDTDPFSSDPVSYSSINTMGHQLVFDDHPDHAAVRLRSSNGSQILINDVDGYIYLNTAKGNTWVEINDTGDINVYSTKSINHHTEGDYSVTVDGNYTCEVAGNYTLAVKGNTTQTHTGVVDIFSGIGGSGWNWDHQGNYNQSITEAWKVQIGNGFDLKSSTHTTIDSTQDLNIITGTTFNLSSSNGGGIYTGGTLAITGTTALSMSSTGPSYLDGSFVMLGTTGTTASMGTSAVTPTLPSAPIIGSTYGVPTSTEIANGDHPDMIPYVGSMVPQHEPWPGHPATSGNTNGNVQYNSSYVDIVRIGATTPKATKPVPYIDHSGNVQSPNPYTTHNAGEVPTYTNSGPAGAAGTPGAVSGMSLSDAGKAFIKNQEGFRSSPYVDVTGFAIGYGHTIKIGDNIGGTVVTQAILTQLKSGNTGALSITQDQADALFDIDSQKYQAAVKSGVTAPITQGQYDAMVSLTYNVGTGGFLKSQMLKDFNSGDTPSAITEFQGFNKSGGTVNPVLVTRRSQEIGLFNTGLPQTA
jgi:lysozyme